MPMMLVFATGCRAAAVSHGQLPQARAQLEMRLPVPWRRKSVKISHVLAPVGDTTHSMIWRSICRSMPRLVCTALHQHYICSNTCSSRPGPRRSLVEGFWSAPSLESSRLKCRLRKHAPHGPLFWAGAICVLHFSLSSLRSLYPSPLARCAACLTKFKIQVPTAAAVGRRRPYKKQKV